MEKPKVKMFCKECGEELSFTVLGDESSVAMYNVSLCSHCFEKGFFGSVNDFSEDQDLETFDGW